MDLPRFYIQKSERIQAKYRKRTTLNKQVKSLLINEKIMKILVTGGTGLIGRTFIESSLASGAEYEFTVLTRDVSKAKQNLKDEVSIIDNLAQVNMANFDVALNLAGEPIVNKRWTEQQKRTLCQSRWQLTEQLVNKINRECNADNPIRFISGSAVGIYGRQPKGLITETHSPHFPEFSHTLCQRWEDIALQAKHANVALLRTGIVLSHSGGALDKMLLPFKLGLGGKIASGEQFMPWIHIDDMVAGIQFLIEHPVLNGPFNFTAPHPVTNAEFAKTLAKSLNRPCLFPVPEFVLRLIMGEMADLLVYGQNAIPENLVKAGFNFKYETLKPALDEVVSH